MTLAIEHIDKSFAGLPTLADINLSIAPGELVCLLGPSGCGKTTLLRIVAGLLAPDRGDICLDGKSILSLSARERQFGIVFQSYSLFPNMTVAENIGYGLRLRKATTDAIHKRVQELTDMIGLADMNDRYPGQLSGGQQQRVALARALATEPRVLLLDEPLSALDARVRAQLRVEIREIQQRLRIPTLMVTHDQEEAMSMADRIVCMQTGRIAQVGSARELYQQPANRFVAEFMGHSNLLSAADVLRCWPSLRHHINVQARMQQMLCIRPEHLQITTDSANQTGPHTAQARVRQVLFSGNLQKVLIQCHGRSLWAECATDIALQVDAQVHLQLQYEKAAWVMQ